MDVIKYYFIIIVVIATALTIWDKSMKKKGGNAKNANPPEDNEKQVDANKEDK